MLVSKSTNTFVIQPGSTPNDQNVIRFGQVGIEDVGRAIVELLGELAIEMVIVSTNIFQLNGLHGLQHWVLTSVLSSRWSSFSPVLKGKIAFLRSPQRVYPCFRLEWYSNK